MPVTTVDRVLHVTQKKGRGTVFSSQDFLPRFKRWEVDYALTSLENAFKQSPIYIFHGKSFSKSPKISK